MLLFKRKGIKGKTYIPSKPISWDSVICSFECDYLGTVNISLMRDFTVHFCLDQLTPIFTQYRAKKSSFLHLNYSYTGTVVGCAAIHKYLSELRPAASWAARSSALSYGGGGR